MSAIWISLRKAHDAYLPSWDGVWWDEVKALILISLSPILAKRELPKEVATGRAFSVGLCYFVSAFSYVINLNMKSVNEGFLPIHMVMMDYYGWWWTLCQNPFDDNRTSIIVKVQIPFPSMTDLYFNMPFLYYMLIPIFLVLTLHILLLRDGSITCAPWVPPRWVGVVLASK